MFDRVFSGFVSCDVEFLEMEATVNGAMGIVCTVQKVQIVLKSGETRQVVARQTDCFEKRENEWQLIHQHASVPSSGDWDGTIITASLAPPIPVGSAKQHQSGYRRRYVVPAGELIMSNFLAVRDGKMVRLTVIRNTPAQ
jgi:hypothetical protein